MKSFVVMVLLLLIAFTACDNGTDTPRTVEINYRITGKQWYDDNNSAINGAFSTLGENTFTVSGINISYTGVYTEGGGTFYISNYEYSWAYLYSGSDKIGFVISAVDEDYREVQLGKTLATRGNMVTMTNGIFSVDGMQDIHNGYSVHP